MATSSLWTDVFGVELSQRWYDAAGIRTRVLEAGPKDAPPLLFLHGVNGHAETYIRNIGPHAADYHVFALDFIGHGLSDKPLDRSYEIDTYIQHVLDFLDTIGAPRAHISGESLGGWVGARLAIAAPERVDKLVLNTPGGLNAEPEVMARLKTMTLDAVTDPTREKVRKRLEWLFKDPAMVPDDLVEMRFQIYSQPGYRDVTERSLCLQEMEVRQRNMLRAEDLQKLTMPTMLVWTTADPIAGVEVGYWCDSNIPNSYFLLMEESGHWPQYEQAELFNKEHLAFLAGKGWPRVLTTLDEKIAAGRAALIIVDVQNDFCADDGAFAQLGRDVAPLQRVVDRIDTLIEHARRAGVLVVFLQYCQSDRTESEVHLEQRARGRAGKRYCEEDTAGADFYRVVPAPGEPIVKKHRYSGFIDTDLDLILRSSGIQSLVMTGIATSGCVEATTRDGFMKDYYVVLVDDCCGSYSQVLHDATLANVREAYGIVATSADLIAVWSGDAGDGPK